MAAAGAADPNAALRVWNGLITRGPDKVLVVPGLPLDAANALAALPVEKRIPLLANATKAVLNANGNAKQLRNPEDGGALHAAILDALRAEQQQQSGGAPASAAPGGAAAAAPGAAALAAAGWQNMPDSDDEAEPLVAAVPAAGGGNGAANAGADEKKPPEQASPAPQGAPAMGDEKQPQRAAPRAPRHSAAYLEVARERRQFNIQKYASKGPAAVRDIWKDTVIEKNNDGTVVYSLPYAEKTQQERFARLSPEHQEYVVVHAALEIEKDLSRPSPNELRTLLLESLAEQVNLWSDEPPSATDTLGLQAALNDVIIIRRSGRIDLRSATTPAAFGEKRGFEFNRLPESQKLKMVMTAAQKAEWLFPANSGAFWLDLAASIDAAAPAGGDEKQPDIAAGSAEAIRRAYHDRRAKEEKQFEALPLEEALVILGDMVVVVPGASYDEITFRVPALEVSHRTRFDNMPPTTQRRVVIHTAGQVKGALSEENRTPGNVRNMALHYFEEEINLYSDKPSVAKPATDAARGRDERAERRGGRAERPARPRPRARVEEPRRDEAEDHAPPRRGPAPRNVTAALANFRLSVRPFHVPLWQ